MPDILWQSRSPVIYESFCKGALLKASNGGNAYDFHAIEVLGKHYDIAVDPNTIKYPGQNLAGYWWKLYNYRPIARLCIMEPFPLIFGKRSKDTKTVAMIHHLDDNMLRGSIRHRWFANILKRRLTRVDLVITVSEYWKEYLTRLGCTNIHVIYNSFQPSDYVKSSGAIGAFKKQYGLNDEQPVVYIGNASRQKGVYEVYDALKSSNYQMVMSGSENKAKDLPVKFLNLERSDYISLLHAADIVISLSTLEEGWNRIAHESLLCKTPVIGSGTGGMKELLSGAGQQIIQDPSQLPSAINFALVNKTQLAEAGFNYVSKFNMSYFENEWNTAIARLLKKP